MAEPLKTRFGKLLAAHRKRSGMTQGDLADAASLSIKMIQSVERGNSGASFNAVDRLAKALEIDPSELFSSGVPNALANNPNLAPLVLRLAKASDADLEWLNGALDKLLDRKI